MLSMAQKLSVEAPAGHKPFDVEFVHLGGRNGRDKKKCGRSRKASMVICFAETNVAAIHFPFPVRYADRGRRRLSVIQPCPA